MIFRGEIIPFDPAKPTITTHYVFEKIQNEKIVANDLAQAFNQSGLAGVFVSGASTILSDLVASAKASQNQHAQNLLVGFQESLAVLKPLAEKLETNDDRLRFAEIVTGMSKDYFSATQAMASNNNEFFRYVVGGLVTAFVAVIGAREYTRKNNISDGNHSTKVLEEEQA